MKIRTAIAVLTAAASLAACGSDEPDSTDKDRKEPGATAGQPGASAPADPAVIPDGTYEKQLHRDDFTDAGIDLEAPEVGDRFAPDGSTWVVWRFVDGSYAQLQGKSPDSVTPGSAGTYSFDEDGLFLDEEGHDRVGPIPWEINGDQLTIDATSAPDPLAMLMVGGTYTKVG